jgi:4-hydroxybutyrate CoA-transferase
MLPSVPSCCSTSSSVLPWQAAYQSKLRTASEAIGLVQSGQKIGAGHAIGEPTPLLVELAQQKDRLQNVEVYHMNAFGPVPYVAPGFEGHIHHTSLFAGKNSRQAIHEGRADFIPVFFSEIPRLFRERTLDIDVALVQVSPPDEDGYCSFGLAVDYAPAMVETAGLVIAEVNAQMPYTYGTRIHISQLDVLVETCRPLPEFPASDVHAPIDPASVEARIAQYVAALVQDGSVLQLGIGTIPDAVLKFLTDKKDLSVHTEMFSDGVMALVKAGVVNGRYNRLAPGKITATFIVGSRQLYDFVHHNPMINMQPVDYTNNVTVASQLDKLVSINSAIQVDFFGEVCSDTIGFKQFSGVGGQVDFVRSASMARGGVSVIALPSTAKDGTVSRIVPTLDPGACVTTSRNDVHFVATEFGCVNLWGKSIQQRTEALIGIAHPAFRESLWEQACRLGFMKNSPVCIYRALEGLDSFKVPERERAASSSSSCIPALDVAVAAPAQAPLPQPALAT